LEKEINEYGFQKYFIDINGSVHDKTKTITEILKKNGFEPDKTAYIGDIVHDVEAGEKAKVITIAVSYGYQTGEMLSKEHPDFIIDDIKGLKNLI